MTSLSWHSVWVFVRSRSLQLLGAPNLPPAFGVHLQLLKLRYPYPITGGWNSTDGLIQKPPEEFCGLGYKAGKKKKRVIAQLQITFSNRLCIYY